MDLGCEGIHFEEINLLLVVEFSKNEIGSLLSMVGKIFDAFMAKKILPEYPLSGRFQWGKVIDGALRIPTSQK